MVAANTPHPVDERPFQVQRLVEMSDKDSTSGTEEIPNNKPKTKNPQGWEKWGPIALFLTLSILAAIGLQATYSAIKKASKLAMAEVNTKWTLPSGGRLEAGPPQFMYDADTGTLAYRGHLDAGEQLRLRDLLKFDSTEDLPSQRQDPLASHRPPSPVSTKPSGASQMQRDINTFHTAINHLAYQARLTHTKQIQQLLILGMLSAALGALLRSYVDFVGHACYKQDLDLRRWWPLYATRPFVGAILGFLLVILFKAKILSSGEVSVSDDTFWWIGMAALGGFSTLDVTARLRLAAKALFGGDSEKKVDQEGTSRS